MPCSGYQVDSTSWTSPSATLNVPFQHIGFAWCTTPKFRFNVNGAWATGLRPATLVSQFSSTVSNSLTFTVYDTAGQIIGTDTMTGTGTGAFSKTVSLSYVGYDIQSILYGSTLDQSETTLLSLLAPTGPVPIWQSYINTAET